jgi:hypothetical protein
MPEIRQMTPDEILKMNIVRGTMAFSALKDVMRFCMSQKVVKRTVKSRYKRFLP